MVKVGKNTFTLACHQQAGAIALLNKPYNFSDFVAIVSEVLETP